MDLDAVIARLRANEAPLRALGICHLAVFGSVARGDAGPASDTDIMVEIDPTARIGVYEYVGIRDYVAGLVGGAVDVIDRDALKPTAAPAVLADAVYAF